MAEEQRRTLEQEISDNARQLRSEWDRAMAWLVGLDRVRVRVRVRVRSRSRGRRRVRVRWDRAMAWLVDYRLV